MSRITILSRCLAVLLALGLFSTAGASSFTSEQEDYIPTLEEAIVVSALADTTGQQILVTFELWPDVYLYQHRLGFTLRDNDGNTLTTFDNLVLPTGKSKTDEIFGDVTVYYHGVDIPLPLDAVPMVPAQLEVSFQGCLEDVLCYPPKTRTLPVSFVSADSDVSAPRTTPGSSDSDFLDTLTSSDANAFNRWMQDHGLGMIVLLFFAGGILLAFTPCVFPMIPILSGIIAGSNNPSASRGFMLSSAYVLGVAVPYTVAGLLVALFGAGLNLQFLLQQPAAIITSAVIFVILSLSMFGLYELQLPEGLRSRLNDLGNQREGGSLGGAAIMGAISALVVSPCVTPILAGALVYVAGTGDALTGATSLFALSIGMGTPLIMVGTGGGHVLPRAGAWMDEIKRFFGVMMLGVAAWLAGRILDGSTTLMLYGLLAVAYGIYLGALDATPEGGSRLKRALSSLLALYGTLMIIGAAAGGSDPASPLRPLAQPLVASSGAPSPGVSAAQAAQPGQWFTVSGQQALADTLERARQAGQPVLVDFFAEWCVACKVLEEETLTVAPVMSALSDHWLVRADITEINSENQAIMSDYNILGLPCLVFFDAAGNEVPNARILGEMGPERFLAHVKDRGIVSNRP